MTQQNKTDNVLVNRRKLGKLLGLALGFQQFLERNHEGIDNVDDGILLAKEILAMPDFIESERDVASPKYTIV